MQKNIYCQSCGNIMDYGGTEKFPLWFLENAKPNTKNKKRISFELYKCVECGYLQYYEAGEQPPEEYIRPPLRNQIRLIQGGKSI